MLTFAGEAVAAIRAEIDKIRTGEDFDKLFAFARREALNDMVQARGDAKAFAGRLASAVQAGQSYDYFDQLAARVAALKPADVKAIVKRWLAEDHSVTMIQGPKTGVEDVRRVVKMAAELKLPEVIHDEDED